MQIYLSFMDEMDKRIKEANSVSKLTFGFAICKKLLPDFVAYTEKKELLTLPLIQEAMTFCELSIKTGKMDNQTLTDLIEKINPVIPNTDDYQNWDISYAINAVQSILELLQFLLNADDSHMSAICSLMIDTTDFKIAESNATISDEGIYKHPSMVAIMKELKESLH